MVQLSLTPRTSREKSRPPSVVRLAHPAALGLLRNHIEAPGDIVRRPFGVLGIGEHFRVECAGDGRLLDDGAGIARMQRIEGGPDAQRFVDDGAQIGAGPLLTVAEDESGALEPGFDEIVLERLVVLEILLGGAALDLVERRLGDEEMAALDDLRHLAVEEGEQQRADMGAVDIGVGHDDDLVIAKFVDVESAPSRPMPVPSAVISVPISADDSILSKRARSTLRILPRRGSTAWFSRLRACLAEPPAEVALDDE